jgi:uncharacterized membrane protein SpoIIM required for sporulation/ABC-type transport system involved in multi-copper enzyme maturation permease subunit
MTALSRRRFFGRFDMHMALLVTRREVRDSFRDWRIIIPIILLTLVFPFLATMTARVMFRFIEQYGASVIGDRIVPFMLLIVGFFPMSFSLVIALETFVGEKERKSLEPLLSTPLTNTQLYVGKVLAALIPPMITSYLGITVYLVGLLLVTEWVFSTELFIQIILLTTLQGIIMVAAAVIISSQTTSVRAANLLASFIIIPMAFLLQFEALVLFWGNTDGLWWLILALIVTAIIFFRMGIKVFNREELLGQDIDQLRLGWIGRQFWDRFSGRDVYGKLPGPLGWYKQLFAVLPSLKLAGGTVLAGLLGATILGIYLSKQYAVSGPLQSAFSSSEIAANTASMQLLFAQLPLAIFLQNLRVIILMAVIGIFTFGVTDIVIFALPWTIISYLAGQMANAGESPYLFILAGIVPHAILELPALILISALALRWHSTIMARPENGTIGENWITTAADFCRVTIGLSLPLLLAAAYVEAYITPRVMLLIYGS